MKTLKVVLNDSVGDRLRRVAEAFGVSVKALVEALVEEGLCDIEMCTALLTHIDVPDVARRAAALRTAYGDEAGPRIRALLRDLGVAKPEAVSFALRALGAALARSPHRRAAGGPGGVPRKGDQPDGRREAPAAASGDGGNGPDGGPRDANAIFELIETGPEDFERELFRAP